MRAISIKDSAAFESAIGELADRQRAAWHLLFSIDEASGEDKEYMHSLVCPAAFLLIDDMGARIDTLQTLFEQANKSRA